MAILKCPNPSCPYTFDPSQVPPGAVLACPSCGMQFTLGPPAPPPQPPAYAPPQPPAYAPQPPAYAPQPPAGPVFEDAPDAGMGFDAPSASSAPRNRTIARKPTVGSQRQTYQMLIGVGIAVILVLGAGFTIYSRLTFKPAKPEGGSYVKGQNLAFDVPPAPWAQDEDMRAQLGSGIYLTFTRSEPEAFIAFGGKDFAERMPRKSELEDGIASVTNGLFEKDTFTILNDNATTKWLGQPLARAIEFRAQDRKTGETVLGEAFATMHQGIGYWTIAWAAEADFPAVRPEFETIRGQYRFADPKRVWQPKKATITSIRGDKLAYSLQDPDDIWKQNRNQPPEDVDPLADAKRVAEVKNPRGGQKLDAELVTFIIDPAGEPIDDAKAYLEQMFNKDAAIFGKTVMTTLDDDPAGAPSPNSIDKNTDVVRLRTTTGMGGGAVVKLVVISAIKTDDKVVFVRCMCPWDSREVFEQNFIATAGSLKPGR